MNSFGQDLRYAWRTLRRAPGFTVIAVVTLALGIGANAAIFSMVHAVLLQPLPFRDPGRLVAVWDTYLPQFPKLGVSPPEQEAWRQQTGLFEQTAWYRYVPLDLTLTAPGAEALEVHADIVSPDLFPMLGAGPVSGHDPNTVLLGHELWIRRFGGDPAIAGKTIHLNDQVFTVTGVLPEKFQFPDWADLWLPPGPLAGDELTNPVRHATGFIGRLRPGVTVARAASRLQGIAARLAAEHPKTSTSFGMNVVGLQDDLTATLRPALLLLMGAVALVLLIACGNIANLILSRASGRAKEMAVRMALGAGSWRLVRQLVTESLVLAACGGALGLLIAHWALAALAPVRSPVDSTVLLFLLGISTAAGVASGVFPAWGIIRPPSRAGARAPWTRNVLVVLQMAMALVLVAGAGILVKSFVRLLHVDPGFNPAGVLTLRLSVPPSRDPGELFHRIEQDVGKLPGVASIAAANALPIIASRANTTRFSVPGSPLINPDALPAAQIRAVSPDYFRAMGIPLRTGRVFTERDLNRPVVVVNETLAERFWPGRDPVGQKFVTGPWGPKPSFSTIIGVAGNVKEFGLDSEPGMDLYFPALTAKFLVVRTAGDPAALAGAVRRAVQAADPAVPISDVLTMDQIVAQSARSRRWTILLLGGFAGLALLLALTGIYGVTSWSVAQRTREIGIRMALGADRRQVLRMVVGQGLKLSAAGLLLGTAVTLALRRVLALLVFDVSPADPAIYLGAWLAMLAMAILACYLPARRASRVEPLTALRWE